MTRPGWDLATFSCGRCGTRITARTETDYLRDVSAHQARHELADYLRQKAGHLRTTTEQPPLDDAQAHRLADQLLQAVTAELHQEAADA